MSMMVMGALKGQGWWTDTRQIRVVDSGYECSFVRKRWIIDWFVVFRCERGCMEIYYRDADAWTKAFGSRKLA